MSVLGRRSSAVVALAALTTTLGQAALAGPASAAADRPDLTIGLTVDRNRIPLKGEAVRTEITVANAGVATADGITVRVDLPANSYVGGEGPLGGIWQCSALSPTMICTHPPLAAGQTAAPFGYWTQFRPGTDGQAENIVATVSSTSRESSTRNNTARQTVTWDADVAYPDLYTSSVVQIPAYEVIEGDWVKHPMRFANSGSATAADVRVRVVAPAQLFIGVGEQSDPSWQCTAVVAGQEWECVNGPLAPGEETPVLSFSGEVPPGGQPGDRLPVRITLSTSTPDENPRGNETEAGFQYGTPAYVSGRVWLDADADGQRDPEEAGLSPAGLAVQVVPDSGTARTATVGEDGTYRVLVRDGYQELVADLNSTTHRFTTPDVGDDATDSDVSVTWDTVEQQSARSGSLYLSQGEERVLDIGLVTAS